MASITSYSPSQCRPSEIVAAPVHATMLCSDKRLYLQEMQKRYEFIVKFIHTGSCFNPGYSKETAIAAVEKLIENISLQGKSLIGEEPAKKICARFVEQIKQVEVPSDPDRESLTKAIQKAAFSAMISLKREIKIFELSNIPLSPLAFQKVGSDLMKFLWNGRYFHCCDYAFYHLNEKAAFESIFNPISGFNPITGEMRWPQELSGKTKIFLQGWGYKEVEDPKAGDLVVYISKEFGLSTAVHWGIYKGDGRIISKWGQFSPFEHDLHDVILEYGDYVLFFRKQATAHFDKVFKKLEISRIELSPDKPVSKPGSTIAENLGPIAEAFKAHVAERIKESLPDSLMGEVWMRSAGEAMLKVLDQRLEKEYTQAEVLQQTSTLFERAILNTPYDFSIVGCKV